MKLAIISLLAILALAGNGVSQATLAPYNDPEAYLVYNQVFYPWIMPSGRLVDPWVIGAETLSNLPFDIDKCITPAKGDEAEVATLIRSFKEANKDPLLLQPKFDRVTNRELVSHAIIDSFFVTVDGRKIDSGWNDFYKKYPDAAGYWDVSAVGYNPDKTIAIVYAESHLDAINRTGKFIIIRKIDGKWTRKGTVIYCNWDSLLGPDKNKSK